MIYSATKKKKVRKTDRQKERKEKKRENFNNNFVVKYLDLSALSSLALLE